MKKGVVVMLMCFVVAISGAVISYCEGIAYACDDGGGGDGWDDGGPTPPSNLRADVVDNGGCSYSVVLSWTGSYDAAYYNVYFVEGGDMFSLIGSTYYTSVRINGVRAGARYTFMVTSVDSYGYESYPYDSPVVSVDVPSCGGGYLQPPSNVSGRVEVQADCSYKVYLSWSSVPGAVGYTVYYYDGDHAQEIGSTTSTSVTLAADSDWAGTSVEFFVVATDGYYNSDPSQMVEVYFPPCSSSNLDRPCNLKATLSHLGFCYYEVSLNWCEVEGATQYKVYVMKDGGDVLEEVGSSSLNSAVITGVEAGHTYSYTVVASDGTHNSDYSEFVTVKVPACSEGWSGGWDVITVSTPSELTGALGTAAHDGKPNVIILNPGTYRGNFPYDSTNGDNQPIIIRGGGRTPDCVVIDAGRTGRGFILIDKNPSHTRSGFGVVGVTIQNGRAVSTTCGCGQVGGGIVATTPGPVRVIGTIIKGSSAGMGGGVAVIPVGTCGCGGILVKGTVISGNTASNGGGGIYVTPTGAPVVITGNTIKTNTGGGIGGGILISVPTSLTTPPPRMGGWVICGNTITSNTGTKGGAISISSTRIPGVINIGGNTITGNTATVKGGGVSIAGIIKGIISGNTLSGNRANQGGGGIFIGTSGSVRVSSNTITNNNGPCGGGILISQGSASVIKNVIKSNTSSSQCGGGVAVDPAAAAAILISNIIAGNTSPSGGGVGMVSNTSCTSKCGVPAVLINNTITGNSATSGKGCGVNLIIPKFSGGSTTGIVKNNIITNSGCPGGSSPDVLISVADEAEENGLPSIFINSVRSAKSESSGLVVANNDFSSSSTVDIPIPLDSTNSFVDPQFVDAANGDYHLKSTSPLIDRGELVAGLSETDFEGDPRILGSAPDIGADEYIAERIAGVYPQNGAEVHYNDLISLGENFIAFAWYLPTVHTNVAGYNLHLGLSYPGGDDMIEADLFLTEAAGLVIARNYGIGYYLIPLDETTWNALLDWDIYWSVTGCTRVNDKTSGVVGTTWGVFTIKP